MRLRPGSRNTRARELAWDPSLPSRVVRSPERYGCMPGGASPESAVRGGIFTATARRPCHGPARRVKLQSGPVSEQEALLATKLYVPRPRPGFVVRPRLVDRLDQGLQRGLILVCAPAGSGKTALLADWAGRSRRPVAWLSLDAGDNDPARFWRHAAAALERVRPGVSGSVGALLGPSAPPPFERLVTALVNELALDSGETVLVLDDYHLIEAQPVHAALGFLLEHLPPGTHLVLASRSDPPLALPR